MRSGYRLGMLGWVLMPLLAFGKATQQPSAPQSSDAEPSTSQSASPQPANPKPIKPSAVAAAADASRQARESAPPIKVIRNYDLNDGTSPPEAKSDPKSNDAAAQAKAVGLFQSQQISATRSRANQRGRILGHK